VIPILDLKQQYSTIRDEINEAIQGVLDNTQFVLGPDVKKLEAAVAEYCGCQHGIGVASGTDALRLSLAALNIAPGDEVITTPFTFIATGNTISRCGAKPVFVDIDLATYNLDADQIEAAITPRTKAIVPVHLYGQAAAMDKLMEVAKRHNLRVVEDCAQAIGALYDDQPLGSLGDVGALSFFPSKNLGAYGDGGMAVTNDPELASRIDVLRRHGGQKKYYHEVLGFNSRLDTLQAAVLNVKLKYLDEWNNGRRAVAHRYNQLLADSPVITPAEAPKAHHVYHQYTIRTERREELAAYLLEKGVQTMIYYPVPLHKQDLYAEMAYLTFPNAEKAAREVLSLPIFPELTANNQQYIADTIKSFYDGKQ
jgi:dTDP-4-amino-4,6-dideoxygalactose transaminase